MDLFPKLMPVDAIITDPPYLISKKNNFSTLKGRKGIHFGQWDVDFNLTSWIRPAIDKLRSGGSIVIFSDWRNIGVLSAELETCNCLVKEMILWKKTNPMPRNRDRLYVTSCEFAIWARAYLRHSSQTAAYTLTQKAAAPLFEEPLIRPSIIQH